MRPLRLARVAAEAEGIRLRLLARRLVFRAILIGFALFLFLAALVFLHLAAWHWLRETMTGLQAGLIFAGADIALGAILLLIGLTRGPGQAERAALAVRRRAMEDFGDATSLSTGLMRLIGLLAGMRRRS